MTPMPMTFTTGALVAMAGLAIALIWLGRLRRSITNDNLRRLTLIGVEFLSVSIALIAIPGLIQLTGIAGAPAVATGTARVIGAVWWLLLAALVFVVLERFVWAAFANRGVTVPKLLIDIVRAVVFVFMLLGIISAAFEESITGLLAASGIFAVVLGFALQSTLADLFSGIAINLQHPYRVGDWVQIDGGTVGFVVEMNWRATQLRSPQGNLITIPNSKMAAAQIVNFNLPTPLHRNALPLSLDARIPPGIARDVLERAALKPLNVLADPAPMVQIKEFRDTTTLYELQFWVEGYADLEDIKGEVSSAAWYALDVLGIGPWNQKADEAATAPRASRLFGYVDLFRDFDDAMRDKLAHSMRARLFQPNQILLEEGESGSSLFIVELGVIEVTMLVHEHGRKTMARLGTGDFFGEMSLLTGAPRSARLTTLCETKVWELDRDVLAPLLREHPQLAERLGRVMARRQLANALLIRSLTAQEKYEAEQGWPVQMLNRIRNFFGLPT
jgi:small-conductance mechanosensitive channel